MLLLLLRKNHKLLCCQLKRFCAKSRNTTVGRGGRFTPSHCSNRVSVRRSHVRLWAFQFALDSSAWIPSTMQLVLIPEEVSAGALRADTNCTGFPMIRQQTGVRQRKTNGTACARSQHKTMNDRKASAWPRSASIPSPASREMISFSMSIETAVLRTDK